MARQPRVLQVAASIAGPVVFLVLYQVLAYAAARLGLLLEIDLGGPSTVFRGGGRFSYDETIEFESTDLDFVLIGLAGTAGVWTGLALYRRDWWAGALGDDRPRLIAWIMWLLTFGLLAIGWQAADAAGMRDWLGWAARPAYVVTMLGSVLLWWKWWIRRTEVARA